MVLASGSVWAGTSLDIVGPFFSKVWVGKASCGCELTHITTRKDLTVAIWSHGPSSAPEQACPSCSKECCSMSRLGNTVS